MLLITVLGLAVTILRTANALPSATSQLAKTLKRQATTPIVASTEILGTVSDATWNRDSCVSTGVLGRELWTCRDSQSSTAFISSSASWTDFATDGTPHIVDGVLTMYGQNSDVVAYFPVQDDECGGAAGGCADGTRYAIWYVSRSLPNHLLADHS
jgi:hypothetical protein